MKSKLKSLWSITEYDYGSNITCERIFDTLNNKFISNTFYINGVKAELYLPDIKPENIYFRNYSLIIVRDRKNYLT